MLEYLIAVHFLLGKMEEIFFLIGISQTLFQLKSLAFYYGGDQYV